MILLNGNPLDVTRFPDNTTQVWKLPETLLQLTNFAHITWEFTQEGDFLHIAQLKDLLDAYGIESSLRIKYLPYGRQDKKIANKATFALRTFAKLLNTLEFKEVIIHDPHSTIALDLINKSRAEYPEQIIHDLYKLLKCNTLCYPDKGAVLKYTKIYSKYPHVYGEKVRDQLTGHITNYELVGKVQDESVLIVDDICDFGNTFILLSKALKDAGAKEVNLFVSHGLFNGGIKVLKDAGINRVFTPKGEYFHDKQAKFSIKEIYE